MSFEWIKEFDLFLLDFDGLLVDTEKIHYEAYKALILSYGGSFDWSLDTWTVLAHRSSSALKEAIWDAYPEMLQVSSDWQVHYKKKTALYEELLQKMPVHLMPGALLFLENLAKLGKTSCVVTNSLQKHVFYIQKQHPLLQRIPHWITREDYQHPKPDPQAYQLAIARYGQSHSRIIGFEDSKKGYLALAQTPATAVLIASKSTQEIEELKKEKKVLHFARLDAVVGKELIGHSI